VKYFLHQHFLHFKTEIRNGPAAAEAKREKEREREREREREKTEFRAEK
jgi:hypothetical protein